MACETTTRINGRRALRQRGSALAYAAVVIPVLTGMCLLVVDWGRVQLAKMEMMRTADGAARYAVRGVSDGTALAKANWIGAHNAVDGQPVVFASSEVEVGTWTSGAFTAGGSPPNAVRVTIRRTSATGNSIPLAFGHFFGLNGSDLTVKAVVTAKPLGYGVVGLNSIKMSGNSSIGYSSTTGATSDTGSIASNGTISLSGSTMIHGDARPGVGKSVSGGSGRVSGSTAPLTTALSYPAESASTFSMTNNNNQIPGGMISGSGDIKLSGGKNLVLPGGIYYIHDLDVSGGSTISFTGPATLCIYGNFTLSGGADTYANLPKNLKIVMVADPANGKIGKMTISSSSALYASVYAPQSAITISGSGDIYGSVVGLSIDMSGGAGINFDLVLGNSGAISLVQ